MPEKTPHKTLQPIDPLIQHLLSNKPYDLIGARKLWEALMNLSAGLRHKHAIAPAQIDVASLKTELNIFTGSQLPKFIFPETITVPIDSSFSWINQGSATTTVGFDGRIFLYSPGAGGLNLRCRVETAPSTPYVLTVGFQGITSWWNGTNDELCGILFRESGTGKIVTFYQDLGRRLLKVAKWNSPTSFSADYRAWASGDGRAGPNWVSWLRIEDDGTNIKFHASPDGLNFMEFFSVLRGDFFTTAPDQIGFAVHARDHQLGMNIFHWAIT